MQLLDGIEPIYLELEQNFTPFAQPVSVLPIYTEAYGILHRRLRQKLRVSIFSPFACLVEYLPELSGEGQRIIKGGLTNTSLMHVGKFDTQSPC